MISSTFRALRDTASNLLTPLTTTLLPLSPGQLSLNDFVLSGDHLISTSTFTWAPLPAVTTRVSTLPPDKTFLYATIFPSPCATESPRITCESTNDISVIDGIPSSSFTSSSSFPSIPSFTSPITLSLCYDHYWRCPKVFLSSPHHTPSEILDLFISPSMGGETATIELHPHCADMSPCISLHPCKHASIMASLIMGAQREGGEGGVITMKEGGGGAGGVPAPPPPPFDMHTYLPLFLKSISFAFPAVGAL